MLRDHELLPPLGNDRTLSPYTISPYGIRYRMWTWFLIMLALYTICVTPLEVGFFDEIIGPFFIADYVISLFFAANVCLSFFVAYANNSSYRLVDKKKRMAKRYMRRCFFVEIISIFPFPLLVKMLPPHLKTCGYMFMMVRLCHIPRACTLFSRMEKNMKWNYSLVRCARLICVTLFSIHTAGCVYYRITISYGNPNRTWFGASGNDFLGQSLWARYATSVYWSTTTLSTVGYGDFHPMNPTEMIIGVFYMVFNLILGSYLIGNMTNLVVYAESRTSKYRNTTKTFSEFAERNELPALLQDRVNEYLYFKFRTNIESLEEQHALDYLPQALRSSIVQHLFYPLLHRMYLFQGVSSKFLTQLASEMKVEYFPPNKDVILKDDAPTCFYILANGLMDLLVVNEVDEDRLHKEHTRIVLGEAQAGDLCGEIGVLCNNSQPIEIRTRQSSQLLRIERSTLLKIIQSNVRNGSKIMNNFIRYLENQEHTTMKSALEDIQKKLNRGRIDIPVDLSFAMRGNYNLLLAHLLREGLDPNEPCNDDGKTALHVAVITQKKNYIPILMEHGADPDIKDKDGFTAKELAVMYRYEDIETMLNYTHKFKIERSHRVKVRISFPEIGDTTGVFVYLPRRFEDLLEIGHQKLGIHPVKVYIKDGPQIEDLDQIACGDHLALVSSTRYPPDY